MENFVRNFGFCRDKRIVLYGIGRYTATLVEGIRDFNLVGLMDRDPANIGKIFFGLPVLDPQEARHKADLIIINTSGTYWDLIYQRIRHLGLPVYFQNGSRAAEIRNTFEDCDYWNLSEAAVKAAIECHDIISFDFYGTLFTRQLCDPDDVFRLLEHELKNRYGVSCNFMQARKSAINELAPNYDFEELYALMKKKWQHDPAWLAWAANRELEIERSVLVPRQAVADWLKYAQALGKEIYILTDMYLPAGFFTAALLKNGIRIPPDNLRISGSRKQSKLEGSMWKAFAGQNPGKILHIGDNEKADAEIPAQYGIDTVHILDAVPLLRASSLQTLAAIICSLYDSSITGCLLARLFSSPLALNKSKGRICIAGNFDMGYYVFGPVILTFLLWLMRKSREDHVRKLVFMARDGWFMQKEYEFLCSLLGVECSGEYILISRQLAMSAAVETEAELDEYAGMPWSGGCAEMLEDRFGIAGYADEHDLRRQQWDHVSRQKRNYRRYLAQFGLSSDDAIVDLGFYGNNQRYLNKLLNLNMGGYYFNANLSPQNPNAAVQKMAACFQAQDDLTGAKSQILKKQIYLESFLTAPYGMVAAISDAGLPLCRRDGANQKNFFRKEEIDAGVRQFMADWVKVFGAAGLPESPAFADSMYGAWFAPGAAEFGDDVKKGFYNDNAMMHRFEAPLFD